MRYYQKLLLLERTGEIFYSRKDMSNQKVSVVTVCYNAVQTIEKTILSVINQTYQNVEYIIIDGASTDGTIDIINKYRDKIAYFVSEPDKGIYDAMNKGIKAATGDWINFMNAGDTFFSNTTITKIFSCKDYSGKAVVYGDAKYIQKWGSYEICASGMDAFHEHTPFCHQSAFISTSIMRKYGYDTRYRFASDYNFFYRLWKGNNKMCYVSETVAVFDASEVSFSGSHPFLVLQEEMQISNSSYFSFRFLRRFIHICMGRFLCLLPSSVRIREYMFRKKTNIKAYKINK